MSGFSEDQLHAYVDGLLAAEEHAAVEAWLATNEEAAARVRAWREQNAAFRALFNPVMDEPYPPEFAIPRRPRRWGQHAIAAGVFVLGIAIGWIVHGVMPPGASSPGASLARQAAIAHAVYAPEIRHPVEVPATEEQHLVAWLSKRLGTGLKAPKLAPLGYELVGGRLLAGPNGPVAHFMYQDTRGIRLTLYVSRQRGEPRQTAFRFSQEDKVSVFYWIDGSYGYALSGEMGKDTLLAVADAVYRQLNP